MSVRRRSVVAVAVAALLGLGLTQLAGATGAVTIDTAPPAATNSTTADFTFSGPVDVISFECSVEGGPFATCTSPNSLTGLGIGAHTFTVHGLDAGSVPGPDAPPYTWTVADTTPPDTSITSGPPAATGLTTATFVFTGADPGGSVASSGIASFECSVEGGPFATCTSPQNLTGLGIGAHSFSVRATDVAGNVASPATSNWTVADTTPPTTTITSGPPAATGLTTATFTFSGTDPGGSGMASFECKLDGGGFAVCSSPDTLTAVLDGSHTFSVRAKDVAGNVDLTPEPYTWTVDATPPVITVPADVVAEANGGNGASVTYRVSASDQGAALLPASINCDPPSGSLIPIGSTTISCTAADALGNIGTASFQVRVQDTTPPDLNAPDLTVVATSAAGIKRTDAALVAYANGVSASDLLGIASITVEFPDTLPIGKTTITVVAVDKRANETRQSVVVTVLKQGSTAPPLDLTPPGPVHGARAVAGDHTITLSWVPPLRDVARVEVRLAEVGGSGTGRLVYKGTARQYTFKGLPNDVAYRFVIVAIDKAGNVSPSVVTTATPKAVLLAHPLQGSKVSLPPLLAWAPVPATYFNVQLWRGGKKIFTAWPNGARLQITAQWVYDGKQRRLEPGTYTWYVWPGAGARRDAKYGPLIGQSSFVLVATK